MLIFYSRKFYRRRTGLFLEGFTRKESTSLCYLKIYHWQWCNLESTQNIVSWRQNSIIFLLFGRKKLIYAMPKMAKPYLNSLTEINIKWSLKYSCVWQNLKKTRCNYIFFSSLDNLNFGLKIQDANTIMENDNENEFN